MAKLDSMDKNQRQDFIAKNVGPLIQSGLVNLGIGLPTKVPNFLPEGVKIILHSENGFTGMGPAPKGENDPIYNHRVSTAGGAPSSILPGGAFFDSCVSFGIVRGGHLKATVLGALEIDQEGNLANYMIPGKMVPGMGGAMDLVAGAKEVIVAMEHCSKDGGAKILKKCTLPLTAEKCVDYVVTEMCVLKFTDKGYELMKKNKDVTIDEIKAATQADIIVPDEVGEMLEL